MLVRGTQKAAPPHLQKAGHLCQITLFVESVVVQASRDSEITCSTIHFLQLEANVGWRSVLNSSQTCAFACTCTHYLVRFSSLDSLSRISFTVAKADHCSFTGSVIGKPISTSAVAGPPSMETLLGCITLRTLFFQRFTLLTWLPCVLTHISILGFFKLSSCLE